MDRYINDNGGLNSKANDLALVQSAMAMGFNGLFRSLGSAFTIAGCEITTSAGNYIVAPGYIAIDGEYYEVIAQTLTIVPTNVIFWEIVTSNLSPRVFADNLTHYVRQDRRVVLGSAASVPMGAVPANNDVVVPSLRQILFGRSGKLVSSQFQSLVVVLSGTTLDYSPTWIPFGDINSNSLEYTITGKQMSICFNLSYDITAGVVDWIQLLLPEGYTYPVAHLAVAVLEIRHAGTSDYYHSKIETARLSGQTNDRLYIRVPSALNLSGLSISGNITLTIQ